MDKKADTIKSWPRDERPRELLIDKGAEYVSDAGLVAILIRTGIKGKDAVSLSRGLLQHFGGLRGLLNANKDDLKRIKGLGIAKVCQIMASLEIVKRLLKDKVIGAKRIENERDILDYLKVSMQDLSAECFKIILLDKSNKVLSIEDVSNGTIDKTLVSSREVIKKALNKNASAVIFVHNHPGGSLEPSNNDVEITKSLIDACQSVSITPLDHILITKHGYISLKNRFNIYFIL